MRGIVPSTRYRKQIHPIVLGSGTRLFEAVDRADLVLPARRQRIGLSEVLLVDAMDLVLGDNAIEADNWKDQPLAEPRSGPILYNVTAVGRGDEAACSRSS